jgi:cobalt-zinc-cadmium efflux system membrane fusion protein
MNIFNITTRGIAIAATLVFAACNKPAADAHAGHDHAEHEGGGSEAETGICPEHDLPAPECGICRPEKIPGLKPGESLKLRLASAASATMAGITLTKAQLGGAADGIDCYAVFGFAQNKYAQIAAPVAGIIQEVTVDLGDKVTEKQSVARIWSAGIAEAVAKAVLSHQTLEREQKLREQRVTSEKDLQEAEAAHRTACQEMRTLGFSEEQIDELAAKPQEVVLLDARAPFAGEITGSTAVRGARVEAGSPLFTLADRSVMWAELAVPEAALEPLRVGLQVELNIDALPGRKFTGKLTWISAELDERTRMVKARAEVPNPDGLIKARMFARARVITVTNETAVLVPAAAIQRIDGKPFVFIKLGDDLFDARAVRLGSPSGDLWIIAEGLKAGEEVAVQHAFALRSQLLISRLGAGCADD